MTHTLTRHLPHLRGGKEGAEKNEKDIYPTRDTNSDASAHANAL